MVLYAMHYVQCDSKVQLWETLSQSRIKNNFGPVVNLLVHFLRQYEWRFERVNTQNSSVNRIQAPLIDRTVRIYSLPLAVYLTISLHMLTHIIHYSIVGLVVLPVSRPSPSFRVGSDGSDGCGSGGVTVTCRITVSSLARVLWR